MPESACQIADVLIVGAGLSGLCAAKRIRDKQPSVEIKVLDRCPAAGGNLSGFKSRWITENHFHAVELCRELGVALKPRAGRVAGLWRDVTPFGGLVWGTLARLECIRLMAEIDSLCSGRFITEYPMNMEEFLDEKLLFETSKEFFRFLIKISCGYNPMELTVTDWLKFCRSMASSMSCLYEMLTTSETHLVPGGEEERGWAGLVEKLVEAIGSKDVILSCEVTHVQYTDEDFVMVHDASGGHWLARTVICAISCNDLFRIEFVPSRPMMLLLNVPDSSAARITHVTEFRAQFRSFEWRDQGYSGNLFLPFCRIICFESTERYGLAGSFFHVENLSAIDVRQTILGILASKLNSPTLMDPLSFNSNCYPIPFYVDVPFSFHRRIILSSSNASCWFRGFINGSVQAGIKAAILALLEVRPQTINLKDVTDMQCVLFKYFRPQSALGRLWAMVNLASVRQLVAIVSTIVATFKMGCVAILSVTWILCLTCFGLLVLPKGYYFNKSGLLACEPFYSKSSYRILSSCALYFPTTMVLMYCYGSSFHANRYRLATPAGAGTTASSVAIAAVGATSATTTMTTATEIGGNSSCAGTPTGISVATPSSMSFSEKLVEHDQRLNGSTSRTMAAISLGFIVIITPWTIQEIVATCTGSKIPPSIDFCVTWIALSSSFWNPFLYWLLNARFRRICKEMLSSRCTSSQTSLEEKCSISLEYDHHMTTLPLPPGPPPVTICHSTNHIPRPDIECTSERYWGDILERTFSSCSINALPRSNSSTTATATAYHQQQQQQQHQTTTLHRHHHRQNGGGHHRSSNSIHKMPSGEHLCKEHRRGQAGTGSKESEFTVIFPTTNSDPQMSCERELHDINCAKNRAFFVGFNHHQAMPDI